MDELNELMSNCGDRLIREFIYSYFNRFVERGMSEEKAAETIIELCDEFFGFWRFYQEMDDEERLEELHAN